MTKNLSQFEGASVPRLIIKFAVPTILSQLVTLIYNLADTYFVGQTNDPIQVAALTLSFPLFMGITMIANLFGIGANSYMSRSLGMKKPDQAQKASTFAFYGAIGGMLVFMAVLYIFMTPILHGIGARTEETFLATRTYLTWTVLYGGIPSVAALLLAHLIRAEGNTKKASTGLILGGLFNIVLDYIFVIEMGMGSRGAAMATCFANVVSLIYLLGVVLRTKNTVISLKPTRQFTAKLIKQVIFVGLPAAAVIVLGSTSNIVLTSSMSAYGDAAIAAFGIVQKFGTVAIQITVGLTQGIMPLMGYHYGAGNMEKVKEFGKWAFGILVVYACFCLGIVELFTESLISFFMTEPVTVGKGIAFARIWMICAPGLCITNLICSIFQAMGKWLESLMLTVIRQGILQISLMLILNRLIGEIGLVCAQPLADNITMIIGIILYINFMKKQTKGGITT